MLTSIFCNVAVKARRSSSDMPRNMRSSAAAIWGRLSALPGALEPGRWVLNGRALGAAEAGRWLPRPGRHELVLRTPDGRDLDRVRFEVRGLPAPRT